MKTFTDGRIMVSVSCLLLLLGVNGSVTDTSGLETVQTPNLRRSLQTQHQDNAVYVAGAVRKLEQTEETAELENIEKEFEGEEEERDITDNETEELENLEEEFEGGNDNNSEGEETAAEESKTAVPESKPEAKTLPPTNKPTTKPYEKDDGYDPIKAEDEKLAEEEEVEELKTELKQEETVARRAGGLGIFFGILAMIFTAHQMSENPDGIYASVCRLAITISSVVVKIICMPCRKVLGIGNNNPYSGHMPISTSDYSYRNDPYRSNANAGFEMS